MKKPNFLRWKSCLLFPERPILSLMILGISVGTGALLALTDKQANHSAHLVTQLHSLEKNIAALQNSVNKPSPQIDLSVTNQQIQDVSQQLERVHIRNAEHFDQSLNKTETALTNRLEAIQQLVRQLNEKPSPIKFLSTNALPFHVISIDSIQHIPVASIAYDFKTIPLEKDDSLAGWRLLHIDYGKQHIEFENAKKEHVLLTHEQIG